MKLLFTIIFILFFSGLLYSQNKTFIISTEGIDSIKIGMSPRHVEEITGTKLKPFLQIDSINANYSPFVQHSRFNKYYECEYKGLRLLLTFWLGGRLDIISSLSKLPFVKTNSGITIGMCQSEFDEICASSKSYCSYLKTKVGCFIRDEKESREWNSMFVIFKNSMVSTIGVRRMVGD